MSNLVDKINQLIESASYKKDELLKTRKRIKQLEDECKFRGIMIEELEKELDEQYARVDELEEAYVNAIFRIKELVEEIEIKDVKIEILEEKLRHAKFRPEDFNSEELEELICKIKNNLI